MTFIAQSSDGLLAPEEATGDSALSCVECSESLSIVTSHTRRDGTFVSRHFRHPPAESCGGGESDTHRTMKSIALSKLKHTYPSYSDTDLDTVTIGSHEPDATLWFDEPHSELGKGVVAEAQYRNKGKDKEAVTEDYLDDGFSVYWLPERMFSKSDVELGEPVKAEVDESRNLFHAVQNASDSVFKSWSRPRQYRAVCENCGMSVSDELRMHSHLKKKHTSKLGVEWLDECDQIQCNVCGNVKTIGGESP